LDPWRAAEVAERQATMTDQTPHPGERLFEFVRGHDRFACELRYHGKYGVEAQLLKNGEFSYS
jgi:hypothetical protein